MTGDETMVIRNRVGSSPTKFVPPHRLCFPEIESNRQQEWEFWVTKLHGADLTASDEDLQIIKNLVNKLGR